MARVLVHYDISDPEARESFREAIQDEAFSPRFTQQTESVYAAHVSTTEANTAALRQALLNAAAEANVQAGSRIVLELPTQTANAPDIVAVTITS